MKTKRIRLTCERHTHAGRDYHKGDILDMAADSADWLISTGRAEAIQAGKPTKDKQED